MSRPIVAIEQLAQILADAVAARRDGRPVEVDNDEVRRLIVDVGSVPEGEGSVALFEALARALRKRNATLPPLEAFPPGIAMLLESAEEALSPGADGQLDYEAAARKLDAAVGRAMGKSPKQARDEALRERIRREVSASIADSLRAQGLTPAADMEHDDELDEDGA